MNWYTNGWLIYGKYLIAEGYVIGEPKATETCSVEYLKSIGIVGFYLPDKI